MGHKEYSWINWWFTDTISSVYKSFPVKPYIYVHDRFSSHMKLCCNLPEYLPEYVIKEFLFKGNPDGFSFCHLKSSSFYCTRRNDSRSIYKKGFSAKVWANVVHKFFISFIKLILLNFPRKVQLLNILVIASLWKCRCSWFAHTPYNFGLLLFGVGSSNCSSSCLIVWDSLF